jgi:hypothetical protein
MKGMLNTEYGALLLSYITKVLRDEIKTSAIAEINLN